MTDSNFQQDETTSTEEAAGLSRGDLGEMLDSAIRKAVNAQINATAKQVAEGVVADLLTKEVVSGMREAAVVEAERALNPEPEPEPEPGPEADAEEPVEVREWLYPTVKEFVEEYVVEIYRRDVNGRTSGQLRWCPLWWVHGEVVARFEALHQCFELLRHGEETELAAFWLVYFDPMMDRILDPSGPFKHCSVHQGHTARMTRLTVEIAPQEAFDDGYSGDQEIISAHLVLPGAPIGRREQVHGSWEFPG
ncbi:DUF4913 domain-containing protein [Nocardia sp. NPDC127579]|uniref:DUF4913 domain-containing protein n=1 Tax=Nocardia sp. NPDC127579 TaxID=3345402 RepID=UPI0036355990